MLYGFSFIPLSTPGIDQPTAISPYLGGVFPTQSPTGSNDHWEVENAFPNLTFEDPLALIEIPDSNAYYVVGKVGLVYQIPDSSETFTRDTVLNISAHVDTDEDSGVMNAVLHPEFGQPGSPNRGYIYLMYRYHPLGNLPGCIEAFVRLSRFTRPDGSKNFDPMSEEVLVQVYDEHCWHNGGGMFFDAEGFFYFTIGDAGGANDEFHTTQMLDQRLMSGLFRIDVDKDPSRSHPIRRHQVDPPYMPFTSDSSFAQGYYIPNDNPWQDENGGLLEEFYALGLRSPHRATLDEPTGAIYIGDVGQGNREEVSIAAKGSNLQWPFGEGSLAGLVPPPDSVYGISTPPVYDYDHTTGNSVIGGFVYRGTKFQAALGGKYIFGDHGVRNIWTLNPANGEVIFLTNVPGSGIGSKNGISSFATNAAGDVFVMKLYGTDLDGGVIYKLKQTSNVPEPPALLSQTGAFLDLVNLTPHPGLVPYTVNAPLWSDRAAKKRWIALPNNGTHNNADEQITFAENGKWQFPAGTVFVKHFELPVDYNNPSVTKRLETRFLVITENGDAYGVTYKWRDDNSDADLLVGSDTKDFAIFNGPSPTQNWTFPSRTDCNTCHNANAEFVLGVTTWQLNGDLEYPSTIVDNQLNTWQHLGMFANPFNPNDIPTFPQSRYLGDNTASLETRVRSYLDANCSHCHRPGGVEGAFDARFTTPIADQNIVNFYGISRNTPQDHFIVKSQDPEASELWVRDGALGQFAMPPLAKSLVDEQYMDVLTEWIEGLELETCYPASVSSLLWTLPPKNGVGPIELNTSNGNGMGGDGNPITINGVVFPKGLGVHAYSELTYNIRGIYAVFETYIGVDDETDAACNEAAVQFEVYLDGNIAYQSPVMRKDDDTLFVRLNVIGVQELKLIVNDAGNGTTCDHADWANPTLFPCVECEPGTTCNDGNDCTINDVYDPICNCVGTLVDADADGVCDTDDICPGSDDLADADLDGIPDGCDLEYCPVDFVSDLNWQGTPINGSGPVKIDLSNGNRVLKINGQTFEKGLGVHATSEIIYNVTGLGYETFRAFIGIDDECDVAGSCVFAVYTDGNLVYQSPTLTYQQDALPIQVPIGGASLVRLVVTNANDGDACDHADWANAMFERCCTIIGQYGLACDDGDPCTVNDQYDHDCNCAGILLDSDGDSVPDGCDSCPGGDDLADADSDGVPDACDQCEGHDDTADADLDGVPDACDQCPGYDDAEDTDNDGVPDGCDRCLGFDDADDIDFDGVPNGCDVCVGYDDTIDTDLDGIPDGCDHCPGYDDTIDTDLDGTPDGCDLCPGYDDRIDTDLDGVPDGCDICPGWDDALDEDNDGVPDGCDQCPGFDDNEDENNNNIPDGCESCAALLGQPCDDGDVCTINDVYDGECNCAGTPSPDDADGDGICDAADQCPGFNDNIDIDNDGIPDGCDPCVGLTGIACDDGNPCTINDAYDENCNCAGILTIDSDNDGTCDALDICPGGEDNLDGDNDGVPDACDQCPGFNDGLDMDGDGIPDDCDDCIGLFGASCETGDCPIDGDPITSGTYAGEIRITSTGRVATDSTVVFQSANRIELKPGFRVEAGGQFQALIVQCEVPTLSSLVPEESLVTVPKLEVITRAASAELMIHYTIGKAGHYNIQILDKSGRVVGTPLENQFVEVGVFELPYKSGLSAGLYFARLQYESGSVEEKIMLTAAPTASAKTNWTRPGPRQTVEKVLAVKVRPNPFQNEFRLLIEPPFPELKRATIRVMDTNGRIIYQKFDAPFGEEISIRAHSGWVDGVYIIQVYASEYRFSYTIVKQD